MKVYLNGRIIEQSEAMIPAVNRGLLLGDGIFDTLRAYSGKPFRLERHLARLYKGCEELLISGLPDSREIGDAISELAQSNVAEGDAYIRITVTGGPHNGTKTLERPGSPDILIQVNPYGGYPQKFYHRGLQVIISRVRRSAGSPLARLKSTNCLNTLIAKQEAKDRGADDAVMLNQEGQLAEGTSSNLFLVSEGGVVTPEVDCGLLPGITRETIIELCERLSLPHRAGYLAIEDLLGSDEAFLTNSTGEILPIAAVEDSPIGATCPGPTTTRLTEAYRSLVREELSL